MTEQARRRRAAPPAKRLDDIEAGSALDTAPARPEGIRLGKRLTEYFSVVTAASFALSILANQAVFDRWGLNFLQLATFADVAMSGLSLLFFTIPLAIAFLAAWFVGGFQGRLRWLWRIALGLAGFVFVLGIWGLSRAQADQGAAAAASTGGVVIVGLLSQAALRVRRNRTARAGITAAATLALAAFTLFQTIAYTVQKYQVGGYSGTVPLYRMPAMPDCVGRVLWTGERAVVLDCDRKGDPQDIRVIFGQESGAYSPVRPHATH
ncbi:hypothetical protein FHR20_000725 [Sphingomonas leidyi]|uniref:Uncharacterized protein n=1 Tax=Sphingomonas leidyi TaxID=68569 RepID=A0A7X5ZUK4_9SPHN|nr:hypothetical protein [Sphingomonas leidyi]NIJ63794.1 hypothetical protein [Sphingomonas leidyi]